MEIDLQARSKDYFYNLNSISQKFAKDIENTREAYQDLWNTLSIEEQSQVINESIITPAAVLKYAHIKIPTIQDSSTTYSWFTGSQLDLFTCFKPNKTVHENDVSHLSCANICEVPEKVGTETKKKRRIEESKHSPFGEVQYKSSILKPKAPPPPPPVAKVMIPSSSSADRYFSTEQSEMNEVSSEMRKTGFDFLDNW